MSDYIKRILGTAGWQDIEKMFVKKIQECRMTEIDETADANEYKIIDLSNKKTAKALQDLLNKIKTAGNLDDKSKISYK